MANTSEGIVTVSTASNASTAPGPGQQTAAAAQRASAVTDTGASADTGASNSTDTSTSTGTATGAGTADTLGIADRARAVREGGPLVQCITNTVVQQFAANALLAVGAAPAMLDHEADAADFAHVASALNVNLGTATSHQLLAADQAIGVMAEEDKPWVLDPVSVGASAYRTSRIRALTAQRPTAVRGNASEIALLAGAGAGGRGVDSTDSVDAVVGAAARLARDTGGIVAVSGERDAIVAAQGDRAVIARVSGGSSLMPLVIGTGCSLGAVLAAYLAASRADEANTRATGSDAGSVAPEERLHNDFTAAIAAHAHFAAAGHRAALAAAGPGTFAPAFLDALFLLDAEELGAVRIELATATFEELRA
ncbi:hydroxyethylthiazole kinase [Brevibacterium sp. 5221]|uniref:Hydroxyethylthiazole kinase n=1 Tax=Brevibacterium rongguiense TaxID=2695267 RepID=A0A6N9H7E7_9MICO|nr:hydroxyethylthiazole kinase [Brevibacterium rongguiense]